MFLEPFPLAALSFLLPPMHPSAALLHPCLHASLQQAAGCRSPCSPSLPAVACASMPPSICRRALCVDRPGPCQWCVPTCQLRASCSSPVIQGLTSPVLGGLLPLLTSLFTSLCFCGVLMSGAGYSQPWEEVAVIHRGERRGASGGTGMRPNLHADVLVAGIEVCRGVQACTHISVLSAEGSSSVCAWRVLGSVISNRRDRGRSGWL